MENMTQKAPETFAQNEDGSATPLAIGFAIIFMIMAGMAVDFNKAMGERTQMQMTTDSAAHAALYTWEFEDTDKSTETAMFTVTGMLPDAAFINAFQDTDIEYGFWDPDAGTFTVDAAFVEAKDDPRRSAVRAEAQLEPERDNASNNIFLSMVGFDTFTIRTNSIYASYYPPCFTEGFVAEDIVDLQSGSVYLDGFCIHSNTYVSLNQNNYFEPGTVVSMPDLSDLEIPESGFDKNDGLQEALRSGEYRMRILRHLNEWMMSDLWAGDTTKMADEVAVAGVAAGVQEVLWPLDLTLPNGNQTGHPVIEAVVAGDDLSQFTAQEILDAPRLSNTDLGKKDLLPEQLLPRNRIHQLECSGNGDITFNNGSTYEDFILVTDCPLKLGNDVTYTGVIISTDADVTSQHIRLGLDDNCADGGGASVWTRGSFETVSDLEGYGAQILALGDISFTAGADGIQGVSFVAGGRIDGTSNGKMGYCDTQGTDNFATAPYFRMVN